MALKTKTKGGGGFFKAKDYRTAKAVLIEPLETLKDQPNGNFPGTRDVVVADVTVFESADMLNGDEKPVYFPRIQISGKGLTSDLIGEEGSQLAYGIDIKPSKTPGYQPFPVWKELDDAITEKVGAYIDNRDAAEAAALQDVPDDLFGEE